MTRAHSIRLATAAIILGCSLTPVVADEIPVGHLATTSGETSPVGQTYSQGLLDSMEYIN